MGHEMRLELTRVGLQVLVIDSNTLLTYAAMLNWIVRNRIIWSFHCVYQQMTDVLNIFLVIQSNTWNHLIVCKKMSLGSFQNVINKMCLQVIYLIYMYKEGLAWNNL